ncbi:MAG: hypothetical protein HOP09_10845 [Hyphomicrobium sp.]|nr:hypothetical protein [Hyphomicrobium sp.]
MNKSTTRVRSYFAISGFACPPEQLTNIIGIVPDKSSGGHPDRSGMSYWEIQGAEGHSLEIGDHITNLMQKLAIASSSLRIATELDDDRVERNIFIVIDRIDCHNSRPYLILTPAQSAFLATHKINLIIDMNSG